MENNQLISIVVPIYNVEKYLDDCIKSIIGQTYKNIEIILVDDGSTDKSGEVCENYAKYDKRIKVIHKENGGLSDARNEGLKIANGQYITFIDSDDYVNEEFVEILYKSIKKYNADISICNYDLIEEKSTYRKENKKNIKDITQLDNKECLKRTYSNEKGMEFLAWAKLYNKDLFVKNCIIYPKGKIHEDTYTTYKLIYYSKNIVYNDVSLYYYRKRNGSIMNSNVSITILDGLEATKESCEFFEKNKESELLTLAFNDYMRKSLEVYYKIENKYENKNKINILDYIVSEGKKNFRKYIKKINYSIKKKIFYYVFLFSTKSFRKILLKILFK